LNERVPFVRKHIPCPCGESSDAYCVREDETGFCFSCGKNFSSNGVKTHLANNDREEINEEFEISGDITFDFVADRGIFKESYEFFDVQTKSVNGVPFSRGYTYPNGAVQEDILIQMVQFKSGFSRRNFI
jgi:hypothetical protein